MGLIGVATAGSFRPPIAVHFISDFFLIWILKKKKLWVFFFLVNLSSHVWWPHQQQNKKKLFILFTICFEIINFFFSPKRKWLHPYHFTVWGLHTKIGMDQKTKQIKILQNFIVINLLQFNTLELGTAHTQYSSQCTNKLITALSFFFSSK